MDGSIGSKLTDVKRTEMAGDPAPLANTSRPSGTRLPASIATSIRPISVPGVLGVRTSVYAARPAARCAVPTVIAVVGSIAPSARRAIASGSNAGAEGADPAGPVAPVAPVAPDGNGPTWTALNDRESHVHRSVRVTNTERSAPAMSSESR